MPLGDLTIQDLNTGFSGCPEVWVMPFYLQQHLLLLSHRNPKTDLCSNKLVIASLLYTILAYKRSPRTLLFQTPGDTCKWNLTIPELK